MRKHLKSIKKNKKTKSGFVKFSTSVIACCLIASVGFVFLVFRTNTVYRVNSNDVITTTNTITDTRVSTVINNLNQSTPTMANPYIGNNTNSNVVNQPTLPGVTPNLSDQQVYNALLNSDYYKKAYEISCVYKAVSEKHGYHIAVGIMANVYNEGRFGEVQNGMTVPNWDGDGVSKKSEQGNPLYVSSEANVNAIMNLSTIHRNVAGFGICQWTYYDTLDDLANCYKKHCRTFSKEEIALAEIECLLWYIYYEGRDVEFLKCTNYEEAADHYLRYYERPGGIEAESVERKKDARNIHNILMGANIQQ